MGPVTRWSRVQSRDRSRGRSGGQESQCEVGAAGRTPTQPRGVCSRGRRRGPRTETRVKSHINPYITYEYNSCYDDKRFSLLLIYFIQQLISLR